MITVHNLNNSRSKRIIWLLEELELPFEIKQYTRDKATNLAPEAYKKLHPLGKAPVVTDGDTVLAESGAIVDTLLERHGKGRLQPEPGTPEWVRYRYWMHAAEGSLMPLLLLKLILNLMESRVPFFLRPIIKLVTTKVNGAYVKPSLKNFLGYMETTLAGSPWLAGDQFTAADIMMGFPTEAALSRAGLDGRYPNIQAYIKRFQAREAHIRALEKNGHFELVG